MQTAHVGANICNAVMIELLEAPWVIWVMQITIIVVVIDLVNLLSRNVSIDPAATHSITTFKTDQAWNGCSWFILIDWCFENVAL